MAARAVSPGQPFFPGFEELLRPAVIQALRDTLLAAKLCNAVLTPKPGQDNPYPLFRRITLPRLTANVLDRALCGILMPLYLLSHRSLLKDNDEPKTLPYANA